MPAVLAAYNWAPNTERYRKLALFVDAFFTKFPTFQNPPFHPKWKEVSLSAPLQDWQRLPDRRAMAEEPQHRSGDARQVREFLKQSPATAATVKNDTDREALFKQFQAWEADKNARAQVCAGAGEAGSARDVSQSIGVSMPQRHAEVDERGYAIRCGERQRLFHFDIARSRASARRGRRRDAPA